MFKVVLWDYTGESEACAKNYFKDDVKVIRTLRPDDPDQAEVIMRGDWNFVLIFENGQREYFNEIFKTMHAMNVSTENIIFAKDFNSMANTSAYQHHSQRHGRQSNARQLRTRRQIRRNDYVYSS